MIKLTRLSTSLIIGSSILLGGCVATLNNQPESSALTAADYKRAEQQLRATTKSLVKGSVEQAKWLNDNTLAYRTLTKAGYQFKVADLAMGTTRIAFNHQAVAQSLSNEQQQFQGDDLPFSRLSYSDDGQHFDVVVNKVQYQCAVATSICQKVAMKSKAKNQVLSPDGKQAAFIRDFNLWVVNKASGKERQLTFDGKKDYGYATNNAGWIRSKTPVMLWSPDSKKIATFRQDARDVKSMHLVSTNVGHPNLDSWKYPLPGDKHIFMMERIVIDVENQKTVWLKTPADHQRSTITDHVYSRGKMLDVKWNDASDSLAFASVSRDHSTATLRVADPVSGKVSTILSEQASTFFESGKGKVNWHYLPESNEVIWFSQRSDWGHLYLYDLATGKLKQPITQGQWNVQQVRHIDKTNRVIYFTGRGRENSDPYFNYFYRVNMDGTGLTLLTPELADHKIILNEAKTHFVDLYSTPTTPEKSQIRDINGKASLALEVSDISELVVTDWRAPEPFVVKDRNGEYDIHGLMYKPSNFDASKKYPVVNYLYPGPQSGSIRGRSFVASRGDNQAMAELGFIVIEIDALGTPMRSKKFHEFYYGNMGDSGVPDQISAIKQLAAKHAWLDLDRVGIWGHSGGGFASTNAILKYPDFYKVAVSGAGNHDNRNYADAWGEKWQALLKENADGTTNYDNQANQLVVDGLKGKLLLAHGTLDDNVPPFNTLIVVDALIKANKDFDLLMLPNKRHGFARNPYMMRKRWDYFVEHLMGKTPPKEYQIGELSQ